MNDEEVLNKLFYQQHNYDGVNELYKKARVIHPSIKKTFVSEWLKAQQAVQMTNAKIGKKLYLPIFSDKPYAFQIDLTFFPRYKKQNDGYYVLYTAININTRFAFAYYCKSKDMTTILDLFKKQEEKTIINSITCDEGTEFKNKEFQDYCNKNEIETYFVKNDSHKLGIINRFHRTLKDKLTKHFSANDTVRWIDVIDDIIYNYNHSVNRGIGIEPYKVNSFKENELVQENKEKTNEIKIKENIIKVGDNVRIKKSDVLFGDKMKSKYSHTVYEVVKIKSNTLYIKNSKGEEKKVKKDNVKIVNVIENVKGDEEIKKVAKEHKHKMKIVRADVEENNIVEGNRIRKRNTKYD